MTLKSGHGADSDATKVLVMKISKGPRARGILFQTGTRRDGDAIAGPPTFVVPHR